MDLTKIAGSRAFWSSFGKWFFGAFGLIWLCIEPIGLFMPDSVQKGWGFYFTLVVLSVFAAIYKAWPRTKVSATIPGADVEVEVRVGDLFDAQDNVVIGINDVFDTHVGDDVISSRSIQGQFTHIRFDGSVPALDKVIEELIADLPSQTDPSKTKGKNKRYAIGTCLEVSAKGIRHYLSAYCRMSAACKAETDVCALLTSLEECWAKIRNTGQQNGVSMSVLGSDFGRIGLTHTQLIQLIVLSFVNANRVQHVAPKLTIYVYKGNAGKVDFAALRLWLRGVLWA
jgi:hypothetical protein